MIGVAPAIPSPPDELPILEDVLRSARDSSFCIDCARCRSAGGAFARTLASNRPPSIVYGPLNRSVQRHHHNEAMRAANDLGVFVRFNLLIFDPDTTVASLEKNLAFMKTYAETRVRRIPRCTFHLRTTVKAKALDGSDGRGAAPSLSEPACKPVPPAPDPQPPFGPPEL